MKKQSVVLILFSLFFFEGCNLKYMDKPPLTEADRWRFKEEEFYSYGKHRQKGYYSKIAIELEKCGYYKPARDIARQIEVDSCMLQKGIIFIDSPYGGTQRTCEHEIYKNLPSCQSLKNRSFFADLMFELSDSDSYVPPTMDESWQFQQKIQKMNNDKF